MTYYDAINNLLNKIDDTLTFPINIIISHYSANYIDVELEHGERAIKKILLDDIPNIKHLFIVWIDSTNKINSRSWEHLHQFYSSSETLENILKPYKCITSIKDKRYKIYVSPLPDEIEYEIDGFVRKDDFEFWNAKYEFNEIALPDYNDYRYQNLYNYEKEKEFINAIYIEFIIRSIAYNHLLLKPLFSELETNELETEEEFEIRYEIDVGNQEKEIDNILTQHYGLGYQEMNALEMAYTHSFMNVLDKENISMQLKYPESPIQTLQLNFDLTEKELVDQIVKMKENYKLEQSSIFNFNEKLNQDYLNQANEVLKKFPKSFVKKQDLIIKALFTFDFIQAKKLDIDYKNQQIKVKIQAESIKIEQKYKKLIDEKNIEKQNVKDNPDSVESTEQEINKLLREQKLELKKLEKGLKIDEDKEEEEEEYHKYPKMNTKYEDNIFNEISEPLKETIGQIKKIHNHIHKFLEKKII